MEKTAKKATKTAAYATHQPPQDPHKPPPTKTQQRRAGDVEHAWQHAKLDSAMWPFPAPVHGRASLTWAVLPTGEKVKWSDLGMDRRLEGRLKVWRDEVQKTEK